MGRLPLAEQQRSVTDGTLQQLRGQHQRRRRRQRSQRGASAPVPNAQRCGARRRRQIRAQHPWAHACAAVRAAHDHQPSQGGGGDRAGLPQRVHRLPHFRQVWASLPRQQHALGKRKHGFWRQRPPARPRSELCLGESERGAHRQPAHRQCLRVGHLQQGGVHGRGARYQLVSQVHVARGERGRRQHLGERRLQRSSRCRGPIAVRQRGRCGSGGIKGGGGDGRGTGRRARARRAILV